MRERMKIAVITAANPRNSGMYSVDLAAKEFFSQLGVDFTIFVAQAKKKNISRILPGLQAYRLQFGQLRHSLLRSIDELNSFSHIVYWGDFLNNPRYGRADFAPRDVSCGLAKSEEEAWLRWGRLFALTDGAPSGRVMSVGGNFQHPLDAAEAETLRTFLSKADCVLPRDPYSLKNIAPLASPSTKLAGGIDCAFLLSNHDQFVEEGKYFCYEFGRSALPDTEALVRSVEAATGLNGIRLADWLNLRYKSADAVFWRQKAVISSAQFILTDIYHLSINALNSGVPVFCLGEPSGAQTGTLGDFKKKVLFEMLTLDDHYYEIEGNAEAPYAHVLEAIKDSPGRASAQWKERVAHIQQLKNSFRSDLIAAL